MKYQKFYLKDLSEEFKNSDAFIECYELTYNTDLVDDQPIVRPGLVVLPGGGYGYCSDREAEPIALRMLLEGFNCFVLRYTCKKAYPVPHKEVGFTLDFLKKNHKKFNILDKNLSLVGFSAGGHLAASYATTYQEIGELLNVDSKSIKPFALILGYPVIILSDGKNTHLGTKETITGNDPKLIEKLSIEKHVTNDFPPTYIFSTEEDQVVPIINSYKLIEELKKNGIKYKAHIFDKGLHGGSLYTRAVYTNSSFLVECKGAESNSIWPIEAAEFLNKLLF